VSMDLISELSASVGPDHVLTSPDMCAQYETEPTGRFGGRSVAVVRPASTDEVVDVLRACRRHRASVVPQGGNTGLAGGGVPEGGEVVMSLTRLRSISAADRISRQISVGAGVTLAEIQRAARDADLEFTLDFAARSAATAGGLVATNAAGPLACRWGAMREQVTGLEVVLADGTVLSRLDAPPKDNAGYDWVDLIIGSEGTLGIITAVRLLLRPSLAWRAAAVVGVPDLEAATGLLFEARDHLGEALEAIDFMDRPCLEAVCRHRGLPEPLAHEHGAYVVLGIAATDAVWEALEETLSSRDPSSIAAAEASSDRAQLWLYREAINESVRALGVVHKYDVSFPPETVATFAAALPGCLEGLGDQARGLLYGHLADGNVHVNVIGVEDNGHRADDAVLGLVASLGGSINAEHGVGVAKRQYLKLTRTAEEIALMRRLKTAFDPDQTLNPGRVLAPLTGEAGPEPTGPAKFLAVTVPSDTEV
jgi:FAD/FMN-containing dehydrogenase